MRATSVFLIGCCMVSLFYPGEVFAGRIRTIHDLFEKKEVIKAYVEPVVNSSGDDGVDVNAIRDEVEDALAARISQKFEIVNKKAQADILIDMNVVEYVWTEHDPVDMVAGVASAAYDALKDERYARMQVTARIVYVKTDRQLWQDRFKATRTSPAMTKEESYGFIYKKIAKIFIVRLFKKPK